MLHDEGKNGKNWEQFDNEPAGEIAKDENRPKDSAYWEEFENEGSPVFSSNEEKVDAEENWLTFHVI